MNEHVQHRKLPTTQAADGLPRRSFTVHDVEQMLKVGIVGEHEPFELMGGELVAMAAKGRQHEVLRTEIMLAWARMCPADLKIATETPLRLDDINEPEPDLIVYPSRFLAPDVRGYSVLLVVEIADTSLALDLDIKAALYAAAGVREYWAMNARTLSTTVHRSLESGKYVERIEIDAIGRLEPEGMPALAVRLSELGLS